jgi:hypothetical protein
LSDAPEDVPFNRCKSAIKYFEYAMAGALTLASIKDPYETVKPRSGGRHISVESGEWTAQLLFHVGHKLEYRQSESVVSEACSYVQEYHSWHNVDKRGKWVAWYESLVA